MTKTAPISTPIVLSDHAPQLVVPEADGRQDFGDSPTEMRESDHYVEEYVASFVEKWDELIDWKRRARSEGSVEGVLRTAERFAELGDRGAVERCIRVAQRVTEQSRDPQAPEYVRAFTERWAADARIDQRGLTP